MTDHSLVIFDLDGTLVDSNRDLVPSLNHATATQGLPPIAREDVGHVVGQGAMKMIEKAYSFHGHELEVNGPVHRELLDLFLAYYETNIADHTVFYEGVLNALDRLKQGGWKLAVCTNKYEHLAVRLISALGEEDRFDVITGGDTFPCKKPNPEHLWQTIKKIDGCAVNRTIMVGDSINDTAAAQAASIPVIAVDFGYSDIPVSDLNADKVISHFNELYNAVAELANWQ